MEFLNDYIEIVVVGICLCIGYIIKNLIPNDKIDRFIPLIMGVIGIGLSIWINLAVTPKILLHGLVSGLSSTGLYEAFKQFIRKEE